MDEAEALRVALGPLEVVEQRPHEVAPDVDSRIDRGGDGLQVPVEVADARLFLSLLLAGGIDGLFYGGGLGLLGGVVVAGSVTLAAEVRDLLGLPEEEALNLRGVAVFSAVWLAALSLPILVRFPETAVEDLAPQAARESIRDSYRRLGRTLLRLLREEPAVVAGHVAAGARAALVARAVPRLCGTHLHLDHAPATPDPCGGAP